MSTPKDIYFIEETCPIPEQSLDDSVRQYAETIKEAITQGFKKVRYEHGVISIPLTSSVTLHNYLISHKYTPEALTILSTQTRPYIPENTEAEDVFIEKGLCTARIEGKDILSYSLTSCFLQSSIGIGFACNGFKENIKIPLIPTDNHSSDKDDNCFVLCMTHKDDFEEELFIDWSEKVAFYPTIEESRIRPQEKHIHLSNHHGKRPLFCFAKRLVNEPYIVEIVNSIDRDSSEKSLIHHMHDKYIELRLLDGEGYGLVVTTTARNMRELRYIAILLREKYE